MLRRPLAAAAASFAAGAAVSGLIEHDRTAVTVFIVTAIAVGTLLFFLFYICNKYTNEIINYSYKSAPEHSEEENPPELLSVKKAVSTAILVMICFCIGLGYCLQSLHTASQFAGCDHQAAVVRGTVRRAETRDENHILMLVDLTSGEEAVCAGKTVRQKGERILVRVSRCDQLRASDLTGCSILVRGTFRMPSQASNPGAFDYQRYLRSCGIRMMLYTYETGVSMEAAPSGGRSLLHGIAVFRDQTDTWFRKQFSDESAGVLCGILFGDSHGMEEEERDRFRENGIGHLLAASGLHVGFVYSALFLLFRRPRTITGNLPIFLFLLLYAAMADFSASVVRAVFMIAVSTGAKIWNFRYDALSSIAFCGLVLLLIEPASIFSSGFQLSFAAVITIAVVGRRIERLLFSGKTQINRDEMLPGDRLRFDLKQSLLRSIGSTVSLQLGMLPITLFYFHYVSLMGLLVNVPAIALAGLIVPSGMILMGLMAASVITGGGIPLVEGARYVAGGMNDMLVQMLLKMNHGASASGFSCIYLPSPPFGVFLFYGFLLLLFCSEAGEAAWRLFRFIEKRIREIDASSLQGSCAGDAAGFRRYRGTAAGMMLMVLMAGAVASAGIGWSHDQGRMGSDLLFLDVGQGDCAHLRAEGGHILFDSGGSDTRDIGKEILMPYLLGNGAGQIDLAVLSHLHQDHYGGLKTLTGYVPAGQILVSEAYRSRRQELSEQTGVKPEHILFAEAGDVISAYGAVIRVLAPEHRSPEEFARMAEDSDSENECSLVAQIEYRGVRFLMTGDIDSEYENELVRRYGTLLRTDILKAAHHGSRFSSGELFLKTAAPSACVIQVGQNTYGHPSPEALERIAAQTDRIFRNDRDGAVMIKIRDGEFQIKTMKNT